MKHLKIENSKGFYQIEPDNWIEIDQISKEDLLILLDKAIENNFEMDTYDVQKINNKAHQIIYKHLYQKFNELNLNKNRFKDESEQLYKSALEKYSEKITTESEE